jgi:hypothetical protein
MLTFFRPLITFQSLYPKSLLINGLRKDLSKIIANLIKFMDAFETETFLRQIL